MAAYLRFCLPIAFTVILYCGCNRNKDQTLPLPTLEFDVVDSLLGPAIRSDHGICYRMPVEWTRLPDSLIARIASASKTSATGLMIDAAYGDPDKKLAILFSVMPQRDTTTAKNLVDEYARQLGLTSSVHSTVFLVNDFRVFQILANVGDTVLFKLIFWSRKVRALAQFDFVIPRSYYSANLKKVESVIGSISICDAAHQ